MSEYNIRPVGVTYSGEGVSREVVERVQARVSAAATLKELDKEFAFYTPALVYTDIRLNGVDPYADFLNDRDGEVDSISIKFNMQIFDGMEVGSDGEWNHVLFGIDRSAWPDLAAFMGRIGFVDRDYNIVYRIRMQELDIPDPLFFDRAAVLPDKCPMVTIAAFVLDTSEGCTYLSTPKVVLERPAVVRTKNAFDDTVSFAKELLSGSSNPDPYGTKNADPIKELEDRVRDEREQP